MSLPVVAIVGRPNVGKSSLFNCLAGRRLAIVEPTAGVTRDRVSYVIKVGEREVEFTDTGGMGVDDVDNLTGEIESQIRLAIDRADLLLFVVDGRQGVTPLDEMVAERLRHLDKPTILLVNKCDVPEIDLQSAEFYKLGYPDLLCISAHHHRNKLDLLDWVEEHLPFGEEESSKPVAMKLAIVGRRNTGKSTFINCLAQEERVIVSEVPGTTRDSIDVHFERDGLTYIAIDTAGVRRKHSVQNDIEFYSLARSERSIRRADVVLLFFDASQKVSKVDKQLTEYILEHHKPAIFVLNKWDLMKPLPTSKMVDYLRGTFPSLDFVPMAFTTAKDGRNVHAVLNLARNLHKQASARVTTGELNRIVRQALETNPPPMKQNRRPKVFFATQAGTNPPTIVLMTNGPELFSSTYQRYLLKTFRDLNLFPDVPIRLVLRRKGTGAGTQALDEIPSGEVDSIEEKPKPKSAPRKRERKSNQPEVWDL